MANARKPLHAFAAPLQSSIRHLPFAIVYSQGLPVRERPTTPRCPAIRVMMMPRDTNAHGTIFGGVILSYVDQAGAVEARKHTPHKFVTVAMDKIEFKKPVFVGDVLSFNTRLVKVGRTSMTIKVEVEAERFEDPNHTVPVKIGRASCR